MRLLHTSDWHLGRNLHGYSLRDEQQEAVEWICVLARERDVDLVVVAGDVFDRPVPPVQSLRLLNDALARLDAAGITTVVTSGNHDSGDRLATYAGLLRDRVRIVGSAADAGVPIEMVDEHGQVLVYPLPYLDPDLTRGTLSPDDQPLARSHAAVMTAALDRVSADLSGRPGTRAIAVGHAFVAGMGAAVDDMTSDSERDVSVGGVQVVPAGAFANRGLSYVALGHLHRPQDVRSLDPAVAYSGSLLRYSLSESDHVKSVAIVEIGAPGTVATVERVPLPMGRPMARLTGLIDDLLGPAHVGHRASFVELVVTDDAYPERMHARLDEVFPYALRKEHRPAGVEVAGGTDRGDSRGREPVDVMVDFMRKVTGQEPTAAQRDLLREVYESVRVAP